MANLLLASSSLRRSACTRAMSARHSFTNSSLITNGTASGLSASATGSPPGSQCKGLSCNACTPTSKGWALCCTAVIVPHQEHQSQTSWQQDALSASCAAAAKMSTASPGGLKARSRRSSTWQRPHHLDVLVRVLCCAVLGAITPQKPDYRCPPEYPPLLFGKQPYYFTGD